MVVVAQLAEHRIVVPSVVGSSPIIHPRKTPRIIRGVFFVDREFREVKEFREVRN